MADAADLDRARGLLQDVAVANGEVEVKPTQRTLLVSVDTGVDSLETVIASLRREQVAITDIGLRRPTLDDVFLTLTGHDASDQNVGKSRPDHDEKSEVPS